MSTAFSEMLRKLQELPHLNALEELDDRVPTSKAKTGGYFLNLGIWQFLVGCTHGWPKEKVLHHWNKRKVVKMMALAQGPCDIW